MDTTGNPRKSERLIVRNLESGNSSQMRAPHPLVLADTIGVSNRQAKSANAEGSTIGGIGMSDSTWNPMSDKGLEALLEKVLSALLSSAAFIAWVRNGQFCETVRETLSLYQDGQIAKTELYECLIAIKLAIECCAVSQPTGKVNNKPPADNRVASRHRFATNGNGNGNGNGGDGGDGGEGKETRSTGVTSRTGYSRATARAR